MPGILSKHARSTRLEGYSLVELVAASAIVAATLVPSLELIRDGIELSEETVQRQLLATYAVSQVEQHLGLAAATWTTGTYSGSYAADGHPTLLYDTTTSDNPVDGGITDRLMDIRTTTYFDEDGSGTLTAGEPNCSFRTKLARFTSYEDLSP